MSVDPALRARVVASFERTFGHTPEWVIASPGRVNLIGEHTDYNEGFVLPCAIDRHTLIALSRTGDGEARVIAADYCDALDRFDPVAPIAHRKDHRWTHYIRGSVAQLVERGYGPRGFDMAVAGDIPQGTGLSSSASLEVGVVTALSIAFGWDVPPDQAALIGQAAENHFVGVACGIMDQMIAARGVAGHAVVIDCRTLNCTPQKLPEGVAVAIVNSKLERGLVDSAYNERRRQCEAAAAALGVSALRDADAALLAAHFATIDPVVFRRARHIITENDRVLASFNALGRGDLAAMGDLLRASHASMRDDFEITVPAINRLADIANTAIGDEGGARMTGGGFGGCVVALLPEDRIDALRVAVERDYRAPNGQAAELFVCKAADGARRLDGV